jgi:hypothetical protein
VLASAVDAPVGFSLIAKFLLVDEDLGEERIGQHVVVP